ncbi:thioredoxin-dependent thiol peroxidase [Coxiella endosymbiont of Amblyomma americanum]|uniref:thioredoxin-dependent thiol peroxidase n=1 Tax=Coxiella endosymbiont of Amblyomma americanum TaxID=325775 RepID=UPI00057E7287|nr:thioredoxin-dependent thiol peroxidase [Coxiella endosymbiont of Amblyomma americanum]AJC50500.1 peroxiredoxin [Coxiella endosymbiont of Amblyomma americanum]AUJ58839.1 peroxiredoxin [Coxiella-like endosymbiont of Amblyomma americanum]
MLIRVGQIAPDFALKIGEKEFFLLNSLKGKKVVLYFYPKDNTPGCTKEACEFRDMWTEITQAGATVFGVSKDSADVHRFFKRKYNLPFTLLSDKEGRICEQYGVMVDKKYFGQVYKGIERTTFLIDKKGDITAIWRKVKVKGHVLEVLTEILK